jgi:hypothetical protein
MRAKLNSKSKNKMPKYYGNYLGIVVQNNDPEMSGKVKVWIPHVSPSVYPGWIKLNKNKSFSFVGKNLQSDLTDVIEDLKILLPWAECATPISNSGSGTYSAVKQEGNVSDANDDTLRSSNSNSPGKHIEIHDNKIHDAFNNAGDTYFENGNKYSYNYTPNTYSNAAKGIFGIPNVGAHVWVFFESGDPMSPVYFASHQGEKDWKSIFGEKGLNYPGTYENNSNTSNHNNQEYRNKFVINQKGGTLEIVNSDNRELLKLTHHSGSFIEMNNGVLTEYASNNRQSLVGFDQFSTIRNNKSEYVGKDSDLIVNGDRYIKVGLQNPAIFKEYKELMDSIADAKQLFEIKRAEAIAQEGFIQKTSSFQTKVGIAADCPLCTFSGRSAIWNNIGTFTSLTQQSYTSSKSTVNFGDITASGDNENINTIQPATPDDLLGSGNCPVCGGAGLSPSSFGGEWDKEDKATFVIEKLKLLNSDFVELERKMGTGGSLIQTIAKDKLETIGHVFNDFPSIRVDSKGKIDNDEIVVFHKGVVNTLKEYELIEQVHVDDLPGGSCIQTINNRWTVNVGSGGISLKTTGQVDFSGSIVNIVGQQTNITSEYNTNISGKTITISGDVIRILNRQKKQVLIDSNLGVSQNAVIGGALHVEGEVSLHHITAPLEMQETEKSTVYGKFVEGKKFKVTVTDSSGGSLNGVFMELEIMASEDIDTYEDSIICNDHTHAFPNVPLKLMRSKDDVRKIGTGANQTVKMPPIPVIHEKKTPEEIS